MESAAATPVDTDALLVHGPFLRRLAASLLHDAAAADDVVQQTWLKALESGPRRPASLRAWLATVTRNLARERGRREGRRRHWERGAARPESLPSTAEIAEREAVRRRVVEAVLALDEPYREVVLLRFYEDLAPRHIARELGVPVETVRTRLKRGLARLAVQLDERHAGDRRRWALALVPLALPSRAAAAAGGGAATLLPGGVGAKLALGALVLAGLVALGDVLLDPGRDGEPREPGAANAGAASRTDGDGARRVADAPRAAHGVVTAPAVEARELPAAAPAVSTPGTPPLLEGRVLDAAGGAPRAGVEVVLAGAAFDDPGFLRAASAAELAAAWTTRTTRTDAEGRWRFDELPRGAWIVLTPSRDDRPLRTAGLVLVDVPPLLAVFAADQLRRRCAELDREPPPLRVLPAGGRLAVDLLAPRVEPTPVRVRDHARRPLPDARLTLLAPEARLGMHAGPYAEWLWRRVVGHLGRARTDAEGRAAGLPLEPGGTLLVEAPGHRPERVELPTDGPLPAELVVDLRPALSFDVRGVVRDGGGGPLAGAEVTLFDHGPYGVTLPELREWSEANGVQRTTTDADGRFAFDGVERLSSSAWDPRPLEPGDRIQVAAGAPGAVSAQTHVQVAPERGPAEVELVLAPGGPLEVTLLDRATRLPAEGVAVFAEIGNTGTSLRTDEHGAVAFGARPHGALRLTITREGFERQVVEREWSGAPVDLLLDFEPVDWRLSVGLVGPSGAALDFAVPSAVDHEERVYVVVQAWAEDPRPLFAAGDGAWRTSRAQRTAGTWEDGRCVLSFERDWTADEAWITVTCEYELLAVERVARGAPRMDLACDGRWLRRRAVPVAFELTPEEHHGRHWGAPARLLDPHTGAPVANLTWTLGRSTVSGLAPEPGAYELFLEGHPFPTERSPRRAPVLVGPSGLQAVVDLAEEPPRVVDAR